MHAVDAEQQDALDFVTLAGIVVGAGRDGMKLAEQSKTQRKKQPNEVQSDSPLWTRLPGSAQHGELT